MVVESLLLMNKSERDCVVACVRQALDTWQDEWFAASAQFEIAIVDDKPDAAERVWKSYRLADRTGISISLPAAWQRDVRGRLTGAKDIPAETTGEIEVLVNEQLLRSLATALLQKMSPALGKTPVVELGIDETKNRGQASDIVVRCESGDGLNLWLSLWPGAVESCVAGIVNPQTHRVSLTPAIEAITERPVSLAAILGEAELTLDELRTLGVGDVIRLERKLDEPLIVRLSNAPVCAGYLGTVADRKAVQLTVFDELLK